MEFGAAAADSYVRGLNDAFVLLREYPHAGRLIQDLASPTRSLLHRKHRIYYFVEGDCVRVVRILHHAQDVGRVLN